MPRRMAARSIARSASRTRGGFQRLSRRERPHAGAAPPAPETRIRLIADADWPALTAYDAAAFGADRGAVLTRLRGRLPAAELIAERDGRLVGFLLGRDGRVAAQVGPLIAEDDAVARALLAHAVDAIEGPVFIDLADAKSKVTRLPRRARLLGAATVHPDALQPLAALRRCRAHLRGGGARVRLTFGTL